MATLVIESPSSFFLRAQLQQAVRPHAHVTNEPQFPGNLSADSIKFIQDGVVITPRAKRVREFTPAAAELLCRVPLEDHPRRH
jgi:hypothetical protein